MVGKIIYHNRALGKYFVQYENNSDLLDQKRLTMLKFNCFDVAFHVSMFANKQLFILRYSFFFSFTAGCLRNKNVLKLEAGMLEKIRTF